MRMTVDGVEDSSDVFPTAVSSIGAVIEFTEDCDSECQASGLLADADDDGDGIEDESDAFPLDAAESVDTDSDGTGNECRHR